MGTTVTSHDIAKTLRAAADVVAALPHQRLIRTDVHHALNTASPTHDIAQAALDALTCDHQIAEWLARWSTPHSRDEAVAELRAAATAAEHPERKTP